jgi:glycosyltransferase involved in cell wall biosynthesis
MTISSRTAAPNGSSIRPSFLQDLPLALRSHKYLLPLMPIATESYDLAGYDVVLSSTSAFAKGVIMRPETPHICYCHTPTRYLWSDTHSYVRENVRDLPTRLAIHPLLTKLRQWDQLAALRVDRFLANSVTVQRRISKYYRRESDIIFPPVETAKFNVADSIDNYYVAGGRLVSYKRFDLIINAFNKLRKQVKIFGSGPEYAKLKAMAGPTIEFVGRVSEEDKADLYAHALAYLHPQEEDFGITAVEAMAAGRPVIAYGKGGGAETVIPGVTGTLMDEQSWEELCGLIINFQPEQFDSRAIRAHAKQFDKEKFKAQIKAYVERTVAENKLK